MLWPLFYTKNFYKAHEEPNFQLKQDQYTPNSALVRCSLDSTFIKRKKSCKEHFDFSVKESTFFDKDREICTSTLPDDIGIGSD